MGGVDDDFNDFLKRRKPVFRSPDDLFEPPAELDRVVLRQAREAIESERPVRVFRNPRWAMPLALAATLVLGFTVMFYAGLPQSRAPVPEVSVQNIAERVDMAPAPAPMEPAAAVVANNQAVVVDLNAPMVARRERVAGDAPSASAESATVSAEVPAWRRDAKSWLAEIERLRDAGDTARAETELAEYKRQQRAYAGAPDR
jgi:hypothetical protein